MTHPGVKARTYIVTITSPRGGGRYKVVASSPEIAATLAYQKKFPQGRALLPGLSVTVTDTTKKRNNQTFYGTKAKTAKSVKKS